MTAPPTFPEPTPEAMAVLAGLLADRGVELRVTPGGELQLRDRAGRLTDDDRATVRYYRGALADLLTKPVEIDAPDENGEPHNAESGKSGNIKRDRRREESASIGPVAPRCDRCGATEFAEVLIHEGASVRRDCGQCGRTWGFPVWYGETA